MKLNGEILAVAVRNYTNISTNMPLEACCDVTKPFKCFSVTSATDALGKN